MQECGEKNKKKFLKQSRMTDTESAFLSLAF